MKKEKACRFGRLFSGNIFAGNGRRHFRTSACACLANNVLLIED